MEIVKSEKLKEVFDAEIERTINYSALIDTEIEAIDSFVLSPKYSVDIINNKLMPVLTDIGLHVFRINVNVKNRFSEHFRELFLYGTHKESHFAFKGENNKNDVLQAKELVEYYKWLIDLRDNPKKPKKGSILKNNEQRILALEYLGFDLNQNDKTKMAIVVSEILGIGYENTRQSLTYRHSGSKGIVTKKNLNTIKNLLESHNFKTAKEKIDKELARLD